MIATGHVDLPVSAALATVPDMRRFSVAASCVGQFSDSPLLYPDPWW
jgi:hypothetical protein